MRFPGCLLLLAGAVCVWLLAGPAAAQSDPTMGYQALSDQLGSQMPTGSGIVVQQVEASVDPDASYYMPDTIPPSNSIFAGKTFFNESSSAYPSPNVSWHAPIVGGVFYGVNSGSFSSGITQIDVYQADDWLDNSLCLESSVAPLAPPGNNPRIINNSWAGVYTDNDDNSDATRRIDYLVNQYNVLVVNATGKNVVERQDSMLSSTYNGINVGLTNGQCAYGPTQWGDVAERCMTDIVVPQGATSYATPTVSSAAALLLQVAGGNSAANNPTTIKAILMAGTDKNAVSSWVRTYTQPLDLQYGAGQLNIQRAYTILAAGQQAASTSSLVNSTGWDSNSLASQGSSNYYYFTVPADQSYDLSAILAWNRPIAASDLVFRSAAPSLADLSLTLYQASGFSTGAMVDQSTSMIDNVQDIFQRVLPAGQYALQVTREDSFDNLLVPGSYALAWQLQASTMIPVWNGGGATGGTSNKWSMGANWAGGPNGYSGTPTAPQVLTFGPLASGGFTTCNNDFAGGTRFGGLTFNSGAAAYTLQGAAIALTGPVINQSTNNQTINLNLQLGAGGGTFDTGSGGLTVNGLISGSGIGLTKRGAGVLALSGVNNYDGGTTVMDGLLVAMGGDALPPGRALDIEGGGVVLDNATMPAGELGYGGAGGGPVAAPAATMAAMPEPGTLGLLAAGLAGLAVLAWRKGRRAARRS